MNISTSLSTLDLNYQDLDQLKSAFAAAFKQVTGKFVATAVATFVKHLNLVVEADVSHIEKNKVVG